MSRPEEVRIRKLLQEGKVTSEEAGRLLNAITKRPDETAQSSIHIVPGKHRRGAGRRSLEIRLDKRLATPARAIAGIVIGGGITAATLLVVLPVVGFVVGLVLGLALALVAVLGISLSVVILSGSLTGVFGAPLAALRERLGIRRPRPNFPGKVFRRLGDQVHTAESQTEDEGAGHRAADDSRDALSPGASRQNPPCGRT